MSALDLWFVLPLVQIEELGIRNLEVALVFLSLDSRDCAFYKNKQ
jgi:hypothetical protein